MFVLSDFESNNGGVRQGDTAHNAANQGLYVELWPSLLYPSNEGCVFIPGLFFAHDPEPRLITGQIRKFFATGPEKPQGSSKNLLRT